MEQVIHLISYSLFHKEMAELEPKQHVRSILDFIGLVVKGLKF